jgi:hypothetical protein
MYVTRTAIRVYPGCKIDNQHSTEVDTSNIVQVVLSVLRKDVDAKEKDWACYEWELKRVFGEAEEDNRLLDRKRELSALLKVGAESSF